MCLGPIRKRWRGKVKTRTLNTEGCGTHHSFDAAIIQRRRNTAILCATRPLELADIPYHCSNERPFPSSESRLAEAEIELSSTLRTWRRGYPSGRCFYLRNALCFLGYREALTAPEVVTMAYAGSQLVVNLRELGTPLGMTHCFLCARSAFPVHGCT